MNSLWDDALAGGDDSGGKDTSLADLFSQGTGDDAVNDLLKQTGDDGDALDDEGMFDSLGKGQGKGTSESGPIDSLFGETGSAPSLFDDFGVDELMGGEGDDLFDFGEAPAKKKKATLSGSTALTKKVTTNTSTTGDSLVPTEGDDSFVFPQVTIVNRIALVNLACKIDLRKLTISLRNCEYNPARSASATIRWPVGGLVFRVHPNGRVMILGAKNLLEAKSYAKKVAYLIRKLDHPKVKFKGFRSATIVGQFECNFPIRLETLYADHKEFATYEPELMPGLVYRFPSVSNADPKLRQKIANDIPTIMVFVTGRCVVTGCPDQKSLEETVSKIYPVLRQYRT